MAFVYRSTMGWLHQILKDRADVCLTTRPGRQKLTVGVPPAQALYIAQWCVDCGHELPMMFAVTDAVWARIATPDDLLCCHCAEARLGRPWHTADFVLGAEVNTLFWVGVELGVRLAQAGLSAVFPAPAKDAASPEAIPAQPGV